MELDERDEVRLAAAVALRAPLDAADETSPSVARRFRSLTRLLNDTSPQVREAAAFAGRFFLARLPVLVVPLIQAVKNDDTQVLEALYASIERDDSGHLAVPSGDYATLAQRLVPVLNLEYFEVVFLADGLREHREVVLDVLRARLKCSAALPYRALPHDPTLQPLIESIVSNAALKEVLSLLVEGTPSPFGFYDGREIATRLFIVAPAQTREEVSGMVASANDDGLPRIANLAASALSELTNADADLFTALVERGFAASAETGKAVGSELMAALFSGVRVRRGRENSPKLVNLREAVRGALSRAGPASDAEAFFEGVFRIVERELENERNLDSATFGPT